jgi:hypothetical protein
MRTIQGVNYDNAAARPPSVTSIFKVEHVHTREVSPLLSEEYRPMESRSRHVYTPSQRTAPPSPWVISIGWQTATSGLSPLLTLKPVNFIAFAFENISVVVDENRGFICDPVLNVRTGPQAGISGHTYTGSALKLAIIIKRNAISLCEAECAL